MASTAADVSLRPYQDRAAVRADENDCRLHPGYARRMLTLIDTVLRNPEGPGIRIDGAVPVGILAPICFQPHVGNDREQVFVVDGDGGARHLAWRTSSQAEHEAGETRFLIVPLRRDAWTGLLDREISVRTALSEAERGVTLRLTRVIGGAGATAVTPAGELDDALGAAGLPDEYITDDTTGSRRRRRACWLGLPKGRVLDASKDSDANHLADVDRWRSTGTPTLTAITTDGQRIEAFGNAVVCTAKDGSETVTRYRQPTTARVAVEREALR